MKNILFVVGTRPEAIKLAPVILLAKSDADLSVKVCSTGQHTTMLQSILDFFGIIPDYELRIMKPGQTLNYIISKCVYGLDNIFDSYIPDLVIVHGDTTTAFAAATAAFNRKINVCHIEAGLRTFDLNSPFPEEFNRRSIGLFAKFHLAPTNLSMKNLLNEGIVSDSIKVTGNTVIDSLFLTLEIIKSKPDIRMQCAEYFKNALPINVDTNEFILITGHRRENFGDGFINICNAIRRLALEYSNMHFVYPVHLNPNVRCIVESILTGIPNIYLIEPLDYQYFVYLMARSKLIITDSGGIQEEAPSLGKPVFVTRTVTERPEAVEAGTVVLVGSDCDMIYGKVSQLLDSNDLYSEMSARHNPYGDGLASSRIVKYLKENL